MQSFLFGLEKPSTICHRSTTQDLDGLQILRGKNTLHGENIIFSRLQSIVHLEKVIMLSSKKLKDAGCMEIN